MGQPLLTLALALCIGHMPLRVCAADSGSLEAELKTLFRREGLNQYQSTTPDAVAREAPQPAPDGKDPGMDTTSSVNDTSSQVSIWLYSFITGEVQMSSQAFDTKHLGVPITHGLGSASLLFTLLGHALQWSVVLLRCYGTGCSITCS